MKHSSSSFVEGLFYKPNFFHKIVSLLLYPFSLIYCLIVYIKYIISKPTDYNVPIISVGNLSVGGSGKTPLTIALALKYKKSAIILRGYGRMSKGMHIVNDGKNILCDVLVSGDEAMIYAKKLPSSIVIVSEDRVVAINKAKELGAKVIFLDDGYSKHNIKKLNLVLHVESQNSFCLPAGPFRERLWNKEDVRIVKEDIDFTKNTHLINPTSKMVLATAIAKAYRLEPYLPKVVAKFIARDHHYFTKKELSDFLKEHDATSLLVTYKDLVKIEQFNFPITLLDLEYKIDDSLQNEVSSYINEYSFS